MMWPLLRRAAMLVDGEGCYRLCCLLSVASGPAALLTFERCDALFVEHCAGLGVLCLCRARRPPELLRTRQPSEGASCLLVSYMPLALSLSEERSLGRGLACGVRRQLEGGNRDPYQCLRI